MAGPSICGSMATPPMPCLDGRLASGMPRPWPSYGPRAAPYLGYALLKPLKRPAAKDNLDRYRTLGYCIGIDPT
jgi:hypothetical protein